MIPKVIHYCWFGRGKMPAIAIKCIDSWKKYLPEYELKLWNEDSFDVEKIPYVKEAYASRKFAFVSDYVRLYALYIEGGVYMDTDVEVLKSLNDLLHLNAFSGFEGENEVPTGIMASERNGKWAQEMLSYYDSNRHFIKTDGSLDLTHNVQIISRMMNINGFVLKNGYQIYNDCIHIFPKDFFCPKSRTGIITITENTYCIHHFAASWQPLPAKIKRFFFRIVLGARITDFLVRNKMKILGLLKLYKNKK